MADPHALAERLKDIRARYPAADPDMVVAVVRAVLSTMQGDFTGPEARLLFEVEELGRIIARARAEIAALQVDDITSRQIPLATDELDAIVAHTAAATESILEVCETLDTVAGKLEGASAEALQDATTRIYEACSFQDITGQRITKVVATLKQIDSKVAYIVSAFGGGPEPPDARAVTPERAASVADRVAAEAGPPMHGPQLPANAMVQTEIDRLLASFD